MQELDTQTCCSHDYESACACCINECVKCGSEEVTISNDCRCEEVFDLDEDQDPNTQGCWGCYDDAEDELKSLLMRWYWANTNKVTDTVRVDGKGMTWQNLDGYAVVAFDSLGDVLKISSDWTITFNRKGDKLTARRSSHDEPCGASFTFSFVHEDELWK